MSNKQLRPLKLRYNFSWNFVGNVIYAVTQWGMLVAIAKYGNPTMVGQFTLGLAITAPIIMLTNLQLRAAQATDSTDAYKFGHYMALRLLTTLLFLFILILVVFLAGYRSITLFVILSVGLAKCFEAFSDVIHGLMQKHERMDKIAISKIIKGTFSLIIFTSVLILTKNIVFACLSMALVWGLLFLFYDCKNARLFTSIKPLFDYSVVKKLVALTIPLGIAHMLGSLNTNIPRYLLESFVDAEALGYFAAMAYILVAGNTIISAMGQAVTPRLAKYYHTKKFKAFIRLLGSLVIFGFFIGFSGWIIAKFYGAEILTLMYKPEYAQHNDIFLIIILSACITYTGAFIGYGITATRYFKIQPYLSALWVIVTLIGSIILIPKHGLGGAGYTLILSASVQFISRVVVLTYILKKGEYRPFEKQSY